MAPNAKPPHAGIHLPRGFQYDKVHFGLPSPPKEEPLPPLGVLANFAGSFTGPGFNNIFRPNSDHPTTATSNTPVIPTPPTPPSASVLELNLTKEELTFSAPLGKVPNRGFKKQSDIELNGVSYLQTVNDVTNTATGKPDGNPVGIHTETGFWLNVPKTDVNPKLGNTLVRLGSIPHGTIINAQGSAPTVVKKAPDIGPRSITPFTISGGPGALAPQASQTASDANTARLPRDLSPFIAQGTITQEILSNPAKILNDINSQLNIIETSTFKVSTLATSKQPGGGTANIAFLVGQDAASGPNADAAQMEAVFWVETVQSEITIESYKPGGGPLLLQPSYKPAQGKDAPPLPTFSVTPPGAVTSPKTITVTYTQIQYAQIVLLNFDGLSWPHLSLATLVPTAPIMIPFPTS